MSQGKNHRLVGKSIPAVTFKTRVRDESVEGPNPFRWQEVKSTEMFAGKKIVVFSLPGAYTPTCSSTHLPGYENKFEDLKKLGVDEVYCMSVNDAFVMFNWAKSLGAEKVKMLPDGNGDMTRSLGMLVEKHNLGFGERSWRFSMVVENGVITAVFEEPGFSHNCPNDPFEVSDVDTMIKHLSA
jgi:peroxiredoxin